MMQRASVVPNYQIALLPLMFIDEFGLGYEIGDLIDQRNAIFA